jgi:hypothetical protein
MKNHVVRIESALGDGTSVYVSFTNDAGEVSLAGPRNMG